MIRPIDIRLNAAHPELPLAEAVTFTGSPSTVLIRGVPPNCGRWAITAVSVAATFPDGSTTTRAAVQSANGVWVATLPATARSGRTANGLRVMADGIDENGAAVTGYILGVADFAVASLGVTPAPEPGETSWQMLYFDAVTSTLRKGDVAKVDGVLKLYNGTAWEAFAGDIPAPSIATPAMDGTGAAGTSAAFARGDHVHPTDTSRMAASATGADIAVSGTDATKIDAALADKASKADATLTPVYGGNGEKYSAWTIMRDGVDVTEQIPPSNMPSYGWDGLDERLKWFTGDCHIPSDERSDDWGGVNEDALSLAWESYYEDAMGDRHDVGYTATRTANPIVGYTLGSQTDKPLASEAEAEALRQGKANRAANPTAGNLAALDASGNPTDSGIKASDKLDSTSAAPAFSTSSTYAVGDHVTYNGKLYKCTTATTGGTWDASKWTADMASNYFQYALVTKTIDNGAVSLDDRASNAVTVSATLSPNTLTINFPTAPTGKLRDFAMRLNIAAGVTAPEIAWPQGVTLENNGGEVPEIADGGTGGSSTILYFSESENNGTTAKFTVKGETLVAITPQA